MKLTKTENEILNFMLKETKVRLVRRQVEHYTSYISLRNAAQKKAMQRLAERGLVEVSQYSNEITTAGFEYLGHTPQSLLLCDLRTDLRLEIEYYLNNPDRPSYSEWTVAFYRELYKNPIMTDDEVFRLERERVYNNRVLTETRIQKSESNLAYAEMMLEG